MLWQDGEGSSICFSLDNQFQVQSVNWGQSIIIMSHLFDGGLSRKNIQISPRNYILSLVTTSPIRQGFGPSSHLLLGLWLILWRFYYPKRCWHMTCRHRRTVSIWVLIVRSQILSRTCWRLGRRREMTCSPLSIQEW